MGMNILVAEDSRSFALLYKTSLEQRGHHVVISKDGQECLYTYVEEFKKFSDDDDPVFDLVILDHKMPRMKGLDVAKEILELNSKQRIEYQFSL